MNFTASPHSRQPYDPPQGSLCRDLKTIRVTRRIAAIRQVYRKRAWLTKLEALKQDYADHEVLVIIEQEIKAVQRLTVVASRR